MKNYLLLMFALTTMNLFSENKRITLCFSDSTQNTMYLETIDLSSETNNERFFKKPNPILQLFRKKQRLNKKITAAVLAFPFPFGIVGLHRIYLGTKPYVPVAYIGSLGGVFGILPFIDFCTISFGKDFDHYRDNGKVFMWIKD